MEKKDIIITATTVAGVVIIIIIAVVAFATRKYCCPRKTKPPQRQRAKTNKSLVEHLSKTKPKKDDKPRGETPPTVRKSARAERKGVGNKGLTREYQTHLDVVREDNRNDKQSAPDSPDVSQKPRTNDNVRLDSSVHIYDLPRNPSSGINQQTGKTDNHVVNGNDVSSGSCSLETENEAHIYNTRILSGSDVIVETPPDDTYMTARSSNIVVASGGDRVQVEGESTESHDGGDTKRNGPPTPPKKHGVVEDSVYCDGMSRPHNGDVGRRVKFDDMVVSDITASGMELRTGNDAQEPERNGNRVNNTHSDDVSLGSELLAAMKRRQDKLTTENEDKNDIKKPEVQKSEKGDKGFDYELCKVLKRRQAIMTESENSLADVSAET